MLFGASGPLHNNAFSTQPFSFVNQNSHDDLATCLEIHLLENGSKVARSNWQNAQLLNLAQFSIENSKFWQARLPQNFKKGFDLSDAPILTRRELQYQVENEGSLCPKEYLADVKSYASSGSTGTPVRVYAMQQNARYNEIRSIAQFFIEGRLLNFNRTFIKPIDGKNTLNLPKHIITEKLDGWIGNLGSIFTSGIGKIIQFDGRPDALISELRKDPVGYLACLGSHMDILIREGGIDLIKELNIHMWLHHSDTFDENHRQMLKDAGVNIRSSYSSTEVGPIAVECSEQRGYYHVVHSNVIVESNLKNTVIVNGGVVSSLLITHLHSYATPIIKYEIGDFACLHSSCPCGHDGDTLSNIFGRKKYFLKDIDGSLVPFPLFAKPLLDLCSFKEFFAYQDKDGGVVLEVGGRKNISDGEIEALTKLLKTISQHKFKITIKAVEKIDWSKNPKQIPFISYLD